mmetsp:Transcript_26286/g.51618  ORF Transcript_26286/g.51618 Transcript_26286/m.51618 type:complete len:122 (+) Transcript_26286:2208-2573(+)
MLNEQRRIWIRLALEPCVLTPSCGTLCVRVCACVCEREREIERVRASCVLEGLTNVFCSSLRAGLSVVRLWGGSEEVPLALCWTVSDLSHADFMNGPPLWLVDRRNARRGCMIAFHQCVYT